jgi:hypothetical protein
MDNEVVLASRGSKGRRQVKRERADRMLEAIVSESQRINNDPLPWYDVTRISVFGSYLSLKPVLGDLDIAIRTTPRWLPETDGFRRAWQTFPSTCPAPVNIARSQLELIHWPRLYILKCLKRLGRGISLHSQEDLDSCGFEHCIVYRKCEDDLLFRK